MTCEKTYLFGEVYPKLKEHCREKYGMEFQVRQSYLLQSAINLYQKFRVAIVLAISIDIALESVKDSNFKFRRSLSQAQRTLPCKIWYEIPSKANLIS